MAAAACDKPPMPATAALLDVSDAALSVGVAASPVVIATTGISVGWVKWVLVVAKTTVLLPLIEVTVEISGRVRVTVLVRVA